MTAKKAALRGIAVLAACLALCLFFSGTVRTITTAKVRIVTPKQGKFSQTIELSGKLVFTEKQDVTLGSPVDESLIITAVKVSPGQSVEAGDVVLTATVSGYDQTVAQLKGEYLSLEEQLFETENKDVKMKRSDKEWSEAYTALSDAREAYSAAKFELNSALVMAKTKLTDKGDLPDGASDGLVKAKDAFDLAMSEYEAAKGQMAAVSRYPVTDEVRAYVTERRKLQKQLEEADAKISKLMAYSRSVNNVVAENDGYIVDVYVKSGDTLSGGSLAYSVCPEDKQPVLRASLQGVSLAVSKGMVVTFNGKKDRELDSKVLAITTLQDGKYADIKLDRDLLDDMGGSFAVSQANIPMKLEYKAKKATSLLPSGAVRGSDKSRYIYIVEQKEGAFGAVNMVLAKSDVTVICESGGLTSIEEDMSYRQIAYMEDRPVDDGTVVIAYEQ